MPGAPLAGPGPYTPNTNNPAILTYYKVDAKVFDEWKRNPMGRSLRELFLREGALDWWWFGQPGQPAATPLLFWAEINGGPIAGMPFDTVSVQGGPITWVVDRFEGDILVRPNDYISLWGEDVAQADVQIGEITVPPYEYWVLVALKVHRCQVE